MAGLESAANCFLSPLQRVFRRNAFLVAFRDATSLRKEILTMFKAAVLRIDNSVLLEATEILGQRAKRGMGDGNIWRGQFTVPGKMLRPTIGETIQVRLDDGTTIPVVVIEVADSVVHFRAQGSIPKPANSNAATKLTGEV